MNAGLPRCRFGDTPEQGDALAALVAGGLKTATCSALLDYRERPDLMPHPGDRVIVEDGHGKAICVIEITDVQLVKFQDVDDAFAQAEGETDGTLAAWRAEHQRYFENENCFAPDMTLVCEWFRLLRLIG